MSLVLVALVHGGDASAEVEVSRHEIRDGTRSDLEAVVGISIATRQGAESLCTGSLIAPNLVVTAMHCVARIERGGCNARFGPRLDPSEFSITTEADVSRAEVFYAVRSIHGGASHSQCGGDLALLILDSNIPAAEASPLFPDLRTPPEKGEAFVAAGYGLDAPEGQFGVRRESTGEVLCTGIECGVHSSEWWSNTTDTCLGDSGGPAIGEGNRLIGLVSRGNGPCGGSIYTGLTPHSGAIKDVAEQAAELGDYPAPAWSGTFWNGAYDPEDADHDGVSDVADNCPELSNAQQIDTDQDGIGDACTSMFDEKSDRFQQPPADSFEQGCGTVSASRWWSPLVFFALFLTLRRRR